jgi:amino acid transporter
LGPRLGSRFLRYRDFRLGRDLSIRDLLVGFGAAWLAFSGLESISQISSAMRFPLRRTTRFAMFAVILTTIITSPTLSALSVSVLSPEIKSTQSERFISELGMASGGFGLKLAVVITASTLLLFASNTAIIGTYHVFLALANRGFLPQIITVRNGTFNTPHVAVIIATLFPMLVVLATRAQINTGRYVCVRLARRVRLFVGEPRCDSLEIRPA